MLLTIMSNEDSSYKEYPKDIGSFSLFLIEILVNAESVKNFSKNNLMSYCLCKPKPKTLTKVLSTECKTTMLLQNKNVTKIYSKEA